MAESRTQAELPGADLHMLRSAIADDEFEVSVALLRRAEEAGRRYPVVYVLDANIMFAMAAQTAWFMMRGEELPEMIVVGIGHPVGSLLTDPAAMPKYVEARTRHLAPTAVEQRSGGGAGNFLGFIRDELIPFVESNYPADPDDRTLLGISLSGLFSLYALLHHPETFSRYIAGSPALGRDDGAIFQDERELAERRSSLPAKLFMSVATSEDPSVTDVERMAETLRARNYSGLEVTSVLLEGETHLSAVGHTMSRGLRAVFQED